MNKPENSLVIVTGATGDVGRPYFDTARERGYHVVGITSNPAKETNLIRKANLLDPAEVSEVVSSMEVGSFERTILIHGVGIDKFEDYGYPVKNFDPSFIDTEVYASNVTTFTSIANAILRRTENKEVKLTAFGTISDTFDVPYWHSYTMSKRILEGEMKRIVIDRPNVQAGIVKVSSIATPDGNRGRPHANTQYWINPKELRDSSIDWMLGDTGKWGELKVYNPLPNWDPGFYLNMGRVYQRRMKEMFGKDV